ncbi:MAG: hypothetical protein KF795_20805 [Labilithrix sp.]|nr:hypothetical protein [Labilithrix sp.]
MSHERHDEREADDDDSLPFDVELERMPAWVHVSSALVIVVGGLVAAHVVHMLVFLPFLVASSVGKRFASSARHVVVGADALDLGGRVVPRRDVIDAWYDAEDAEPRATVAFGEDVELAVLHFENSAQARRFAEALSPDERDDAPNDATRPSDADASDATRPSDADASGALQSRRALVAGHRPRPIDMLASLRFVAIAAAFFSTGSWYGLFVLLFFALGARSVLVAKQLVAKRTELEIRSVLGVQAYPYSDVEGVDVDAGVIQLAGGREIAIPRSSLRDGILGSPPWLERARARVLTHVRRQS